MPVLSAACIIYRKFQDISLYLRFHMLRQPCAKVAKCCQLSARNAIGGDLKLISMMLGYHPTASYDHACFISTVCGRLIAHLAALLSYCRDQRGSVTFVRQSFKFRHRRPFRIRVLWTN